MSGRLTSVIAAVAALAAAASISSAEKMKKAPRQPLEITKSSYVITQGGEKKGSEDILQTVYNDNTVTFDVTADFSPVAEVSLHQDADLELEEESYFPMKYHLDKKIRQKDSDVELFIDVEMFANVAVMTTGTKTQSATRNIVVPTGSAFVETGVVYIYYQFLHWYDRDRGGPQNFDVLDVGSGESSTVSMQLVTQDTVTVDDADIPTDLYVVNREKYDVKLYVATDGRIVRAEQNMLRFDLADWSREDLQGSGAAKSE
jgi:hypothetical protein